MGHKSFCRSVGFNSCWIGILLIIGACGPSDMTQGARENAKQQSQCGLRPSAAGTRSWRKKRSPAPACRPPERDRH